MRRAFDRAAAAAALIRLVLRDQATKSYDDERARDTCVSAEKDFAPAEIKLGL